MKIARLLLVLFMIIPCIANGQNTTGLISFDHTQSQDGYNLFFPHNQGSVFLIDNCGEIVNRWDDPNFKPGNGVYLTDNGNLYVCKGNGAVSNPFIHAGGGGEKVEIRDWDNNLIWEFTYNDSLKRMHHDIAVKPNGNVLVLAWERKTAAEAIAAGRDTALLPDGELWPEHVIEVQPIGSDSFNIVWEWHVWDHLIQDYDSTKANFGVVANNPRRIDINYDNSNGAADWQHANSIDYNADLEQILISIPTFNEIWIIDQSTNTSQAAGSTGGFSGRGGDLLFRWGNPAAYQQGTATDQKLFYQHDAHWVDIGLTSAHPDYGKIAIFNNRVGSDFSTANIIAPVFTSYDWSYPLTGGVWGPFSFDWEYMAPVPQDLYSNILSSVQRLENGNTLITAGRPGYSFEITPQDSVIWEYINPMISGNPVAQGTVVPLSGNLNFRMNRYPADYPAFAGRDMSGKGFIETSPDTSFCTLPVATRQIYDFNNVKVFPNPTDYQLTIDLSQTEVAINQITVYTMLGTPVVDIQNPSKNVVAIDVATWTSGVYILTINGQVVEKIIVE